MFVRVLELAAGAVEAAVVAVYGERAAVLVCQSQRLQLCNDEYEAAAAVPRVGAAAAAVQTLQQRPRRNDTVQASASAKFSR